MRNWLIGIGLWVFATAGCNQKNPTLAAANLLAVDDLSMVCVQTDGSSRVYVEKGRPIEECADSTASNRRLLALATQRETGEVAVLDASACGFPSGNAQQPCSATLVDVEIAQPGLNFLPVGAEPVGIVSTPGGTASFVAVGEPGRTGIFGLPTSCIGVRQRWSDEPRSVRDLRTWPACRLPVAPGAVTLFRDLERRELRCDKEPDAPQGEEDRECPADLSSEARGGRLKLAVTLPTLGQVWTLDAQEVLDREPGTYGECLPEVKLDLSTQRPERLTQPVPQEMSSEEQVYSGLSSSFAATPTDIASDLFASHAQMYVADRSAPVVHVLDTRDACKVTEVEPLYPLSFTEPEAVIGTRKVALSPVVDSGARYLYAVEESTRVTSGSVLAFDVSPNSASSRTPLVIEGTGLIPNHLPDRINVGGEVSDVEFFVRDLEVVDENGVSRSGVRCEASPDQDESAGALFRPTSSGGGAGPGQLRGLFAMASLSSGSLAVIDVDDYDSACRRPSAVNSGDADDETGCPGDAELFGDVAGSELNETSLLRVTDEATCDAVVPHHVRGRAYYTEGVGVPRLRALPRLRSGAGTSLLVDQSTKGKQHPRMLVPYGQSGSMLVGTTEFSTDGDDGSRLESDPRVNEASGLLLPTTEPRSYSRHTGLGAITYEGVLAGAIQARVSLVDGADYPRADAAGTDQDRIYGVLSTGPGALLCDVGLEDQTTIAERAETLQATASGVADVAASEYKREFAAYYGDYVELLEPLLADTHDYWDGEGKRCGEEYRGDGIDGRRVCELEFGLLAEGQPTRDFRIVRAFDDELLVEPRTFRSDKERSVLLELMSCCFPDATWYVPRASHQWVYREASTLFHAIEVGEQGECLRSALPGKANFDFRVFEVSCAGDDCDGVGALTSDEVPVCVLDSTSSETLENLPYPCTYDGVTAQLTVYRGQEPSSRGMEFSWVVSGGFSPFVMPMTSFGTRKFSVPQRMHFFPQVGRLAVTDGGPPSGTDNRPLGFVLLGFENAAGASEITFSTVNYYYY